MTLDDPMVCRALFHPRTEDREYVPQGTPTRTQSGDAVLGGYLHVNPTSEVLLLFFQGNGEIATDYDRISSLYTGCGVSFWVVDYRGYGRSTGTPSFSSMFQDADAVLRDIPRVSETVGKQFRRVLVMGRSLGSAPAIFLAAEHGDRFDGLLLNSPFAHGLHLIHRLGGPMLRQRDLPGFRDSLDRMSECVLPTLIIHGTDDRIIPVSEAEALYRVCGSESKRLVRISGAGHNTLLLKGLETYRAEIRDYVTRTTGSSGR